MGPLTAWWLRGATVAVALTGAAAHPCDAEAATACPFDGGASLGKCLRDPLKHEAPTTIGAECTAFLAIHDACAAEFTTGTCGGSSYTDDATLCLTSWLAKADLTAGCAAALPKPEVKEEKKLSAEDEAKRAKRKRAREKAAKEVRHLNEKNAAKESAKPARSPSRKAKVDPTYDDL